MPQLSPTHSHRALFTRSAQLPYNQSGRRDRTPGQKTVVRADQSPYSPTKDLLPSVFLFCTSLSLFGLLSKVL